MRLYTFAAVAMLIAATLVVGTTRYHRASCGTALEPAMDRIFHPDRDMCGPSQASPFQVASND